MKRLTDKENIVKMDNGEITIDKEKNMVVCYDNPDAKNHNDNRKIISVDTFNQEFAVKGNGTMHFHIYFIPENHSIEIERLLSATRPLFDKSSPYYTDKITNEKTDELHNLMNDYLISKGYFGLYGETLKCIGTDAFQN